MSPQNLLTFPSPSALLPSALRKSLDVLHHAHLQIIYSIHKLFVYALQCYAYSWARFCYQRCVIESRPLRCCVFVTSAYFVWVILLCVCALTGPFVEVEVCPHNYLWGTQEQELTDSDGICSLMTAPTKSFNPPSLYLGIVSMSLFN